jgi:hypothetical protein
MAAVEKAVSNESPLKARSAGLSKIFNGEASIEAISNGENDGVQWLRNAIINQQ